MSIKAARRPTVKHPILQDMLGDHPARMLQNELNDAMIRKARAALRVNPFWMDFYSKIQLARRCSCFGVSDTADAFCVSCFGTGWVGGYEKHLCHTEMLETTRPNVRLVNVLPDTKSQRTPVPYILINTATAGYVETTFHLEPNVGKLDLWKIHAYEPPDTSITPLLQRRDGQWIPATFDSVQAALSNGIIKMRIELRRKSPQSPQPYLKAMRLRYQLIEGATQVPVNTPIEELSQQLQDMGIWETYNSLQFFTDDTLSAIRNEDLFRNARNGTIWKVIQVKDFAPAQRTQDWMLNCRLIQPFDPQFNFPF